MAEAPALEVGNCRCFCFCVAGGEDTDRARGATGGTDLRSGGPYLREQFDRNRLIGRGRTDFRSGARLESADDSRLGYNSGKRAEVVVIDPTWDDGILMMQTISPQIHTFVSHLLETEYREVYNRRGYRVLVRHPPG